MHLNRCANKNNLDVGRTIEILEAPIKEAFLKKGRKFFSADHHLILCSKDKLCRPLKNGSFEVNYLV
jgi:hypothetical protein